MHGSYGVVHGGTLPHSDGITVFVDHGNALICSGLMAILRKQAGFEAVNCKPGWNLEAGALHGASRGLVIADYEAGLRHIESPTAGSHRVVILTHRDSEAEICHALERGARGYLLFDVSPAELTESLKLAHRGRVALAPSVAIRVAARLKQRPLTQRERDVLAQMILGLSNKVIARRLTVSTGTVKTHVKSILDKLQAVGRTQAVTIAQQRGLLAPETGVLRRMPTLRGQSLIYGGQMHRRGTRDGVPLFEYPLER